ncbi:MAG: carboxypeptidase-like regulatory domain-containing protein [Thermomicrobiales bacterium]
MTRLLSLASFRQSPANAVSFGLVTAVVPVTLWDQAGANWAEVKGTLTLDRRPIAGAVLTANAYTLPQPTGSDGTFSFQQDQTQLDRTVIRVKDLSSATIDGQPLTDAQRSALQSAQDEVDIAFLIMLNGAATLKAGQSDQRLAGHATFVDKKTPAPRVMQSGYHLTGIVTDAQGKPMPSVHVSISDDEGETWALSGATGDDGVYTIRFFPDGNTSFSLRVAVGDNLLRSDTSVTFAAASSARVDLVTDAAKAQLRGVNADGSFAVQRVPGAEWIGYLVGLAEGDVPVSAALTWPDEKGAFTISVSSLRASAPLRFFQLRLRFFTDAAISPGGEVPSAIIPSKLDPRTPMNLPPDIKIT